MKDFEKIFREYLILNESRLSFQKKEFKDVYIGGNHLLRRYEFTYTIHFLTSPDSITIPTQYIDLFTSFNTEYSGIIAELLSEKENPQDKTINKLLRYLLQLSRDIQSSMLFYKTESILMNIEKIVDLNNLEQLRGIVRELTGLKIDPWRIENLNQNVSI